MKSNRKKASFGLLFFTRHPFFFCSRRSDCDLPELGIASSTQTNVKKSEKQLVMIYWCINWSGVWDNDDRKGCVPKTGRSFILSWSSLVSQVDCANCHKLLWKLVANIWSREYAMDGDKEGSEVGCQGRGWCCSCWCKQDKIFIQCGVPVPNGYIYGVITKMAHIKTTIQRELLVGIGALSPEHSWPHLQWLGNTDCLVCDKLCASQWLGRARDLGLARCWSCTGSHCCQPFSNDATCHQGRCPRFRARGHGVQQLGSIQMVHSGHVWCCWRSGWVMMPWWGSLETK